MVDINVNNDINDDNGDNGSNNTTAGKNDNSDSGTWWTNSFIIKLSEIIVHINLDIHRDTKDTQIRTNTHAHTHTHTSTHTYAHTRTNTPTKRNT